MSIKKFTRRMFLKLFPEGALAGFAARYAGILGGIGGVASIKPIVAPRDILPIGMETGNTGVPTRVPPTPAEILQSSVFNDDNQVFLPLVEK